MKAAGPSRKKKKMKMQWNDTESKCVVHYAENFPEEASRLDQEIMLEAEINVTPSFDKVIKSHYIEQIAYTKNLDDFAIEVAAEAMRLDK